MRINRPTFRLIPLLIIVMGLLTSHFTVANETLTTKLLFVGSAHSNKAKVSLLKEITTKNQINNWQITYKSARSLKDLQQAQSLFNQQDIIIFDAVSANEAAKTFGKYFSLINANSQTKFISLKWLNNPKSNRGFTTAQLQILSDYWQNAGRKNLANLLSFFSEDVLKQGNNIAVQAPIIFPMQGIYHPSQPNLISNSLTAYQAWSMPKKNQPRIAILLQRALIESEQTQLIDATTDHHLWAERYDGKMDNIFGLQDKITQKIVAALAVKLAKGEQENLASRETSKEEKIFFTLCGR